jgi:hypothetical protein
VIALQTKKEIYIFLLTLSNFLSKVWTGFIIIKNLIELMKERKKKRKEGKRERNEVNCGANNEE